MLDFIKEKISCWDYLKECQSPIFIYGMGDGALKIMSVLAEKNIFISGFFASDEFVRGHYFENHKVHSLAEVEGFLDDFTIILAFAAGYPALVEKVTDISKRHILIAPDVPVAGEGIFTYEYCCENAEKLQEVYDMLADERSRRAFADVINFKISGNPRYLNAITTEKSEVFEEIFHFTKDEIYLDLGAYNGDTALEFMEVVGNKFNKIYAIEPDLKNYKKLLKTLDGIAKIEPINAAVWDTDTVLTFATKAGRQSAVSSRGTQIRALSVDTLLENSPCTYIKMDVEGAEHRAILGAKNTIKNYAPKLAMSVYHRNEDLFDLPLLVKSINPNYKFYLRHQLYIPAWETNLYAVPI